MDRPYETVSDITIDVMLEMSLYKLNMTEETIKHELIMQDIGYLVVEQLMRLNQ